MSHIPYYGEEFADEIGPASEDVLDQADTVYLNDLEVDEPSELARAGVDDLTPVDTFLAMQGDRTYVTHL